jgi:hypothetical protein
MAQSRLKCLLVKGTLSTGVPTILEAFVLVGSDLLHSHQTTYCASPSCCRSATLVSIWY